MLPLFQMTKEISDKIITVVTFTVLHQPFDEHDAFGLFTLGIILIKGTVP